MEILNSEQYISEKLNIKPVSKSRLIDTAKIKTFIKEYNLVYNKETMLYDCDGDVDLTEKGLTEFPVSFGVVKGNFFCAGNKLTSLKGAPQEVKGNFDCRYNELTSLEGAPQKVGDSFYCSHNKLKTLKNAPQEIKWNLWCDNNELETLEGAPKEIGGDLHCEHNKLKTFEGAPQRIGTGYSNSTINCSNNNIESFVGIPNCDQIDISHNKLKTLEGSPRVVKYKLDCSDNELESFDGAPKRVGDFYCRNNPKLNPPREKPNWVNNKYIIF